MILHVALEANPYDIVIEKGALNRAQELLKLNRKVMVVTDSGVPGEYAEIIMKQCKDAYLHVIKEGEESKNFDNFLAIQKDLLDNGFSRKDCIVAVGGGVVGDLSGFVASTYMRGIDFYNIPTTVLSQVDSSIGGKTAVDFNGVKNVIGTFYQPKKVIIDVNVLNTLSARLISNGLSEAFKMALTFDEELFEIFEEGVDTQDLTDILARSIDLKRKVVEEDEKEAGLRKVLNFGHTLGHGIEMAAHGSLLHGEAVAIGMLMMCSPEVKERILKVMNSLNLPTCVEIDVEEAIEAVSHDKKLNGKAITTVMVNKAGSFELVDQTPDELKDRLIAYMRG